MRIKKQKGVTIISLVVTIVVIFIIAGASMSMIFDYDGLLQSSQKSKESYQNYANTEDEKTDNLINILDEEMKK